MITQEKQKKVLKCTTRVATMYSGQIFALANSLYKYLPLRCLSIPAVVQQMYEVGLHGAKK